jgi:O-antigen/teichoic acid export membrane protein
MRSVAFLKGLSASWLATLATVIYSVLSVPIALRYLSVEEFGLFVLLLQVSGYFVLLEIGMSAAASRILVDYKDSRNGGEYGSVITTASCVFAVQGLCILTFGVFGAPLIVTAVGVPNALLDVATLLLQWLAVASALTIGLRAYAAVLYANKRLDFINALTGSNMLFGLALLALILGSGAGLAGLVWLFLAQTVVAITLPILACHRLRLLPSRGHWGRPSMARFCELFSFGKDVFLVNIGTQVLDASQLIIVTRTMGLTAAAVWSVSTKLFTLVYQLVTKIEGTAIVFFGEMMVRGETEKLAERFRQIYQLTAGVAVILLAVMVTINKSFVSLWADPSLAWPVALSIMTAALVFLNSLTRCSADLIVFSKRLGALRYMYFVEAAVFVLLALWLSTLFGFYGILGASLLCLILFRATYTTWRMSKYFSTPMTCFCWTWLKRPILTAIFLIPLAVSARWLASTVSNEWAQLLLAITWVGVPSLIALFTFVLPRDIRSEIALKWQASSFSAKH